MKKQNKKILSLLMALVMCLSLLPSVAFAAEDTSGLQTIINNAAAGSTVTLTDNYILTDTVTIDKAITIDGNGKTITITGSNKDALNITADGVTVKNLNIVTDYGNAVNCTAKTLTVEGCNILTTKRGVNFTATNYPNAALTVKNTVIKNKNVSNYDTSADYGNDNRGINACDVKGGSVTIDGCQILGFKYSINALVLAPNANGTGLRDGEKTTYTLTNNIVKGWTALSIWSANTNFNITSCTLVGINAVEGGSWNAYSTIKANDGIYGSATDKSSVVTLNGGVVKAVQINDNAESAFSVDDTLQTQFVFEDTVDVELYGPAGSQLGLFNFYWATSQADANAYINSIDTLGNIELAAGTTEQYLSGISTANVVAEEELPVTFEPCHVGGND